MAGGQIDHARSNRHRIHRHRAPLSLAVISWLCMPSPLLADGIQLVSVAGQKAMLTAPGTQAAGPSDANVTIVEYFDYDCPYCKKMTPVFAALLVDDRHVRILYKDWPILGEVSVYAARAAIASQWQSKYLTAHDALLTALRLSTPAQVDAVLSRAGINLEALAKDRVKHAAEINALLERNEEEARALELRGTPGIVVGRQLLPGIVDLGGLKHLLADARAAP